MKNYEKDSIRIIDDGEFFFLVNQMLKIILT